MSLFKRTPYAGAVPEPLTGPEFQKLQRWEWWMLRFYTGAMTAIALAIVLIGGYGTVTWVRHGVVWGVIGLVAAATWVQFRERCPRCASLIGRQSRLILPPKCKHCGVRFSAPAT